MASATGAWTPGSLLIDGKSICGAVRIGPVSLELTERGMMEIQTMEARIPKAALGREPRIGEVASVNGRAFKLVRVDGYMEDELDWFVSGSRTPGGDF